MVCHTMTKTAVAFESIELYVQYFCGIAKAIFGLLQLRILYTHDQSKAVNFQALHV